jgi:hypothetical protein
MRRVIAIAVTGVSLAGCSSFSLDSLRPAPAPVPIQLDSIPQGADAVTSLGPSCKTPCSIPITVPEAAGFTVTFTLPKLPPVTVPVQVIRTPGDFTTPATATFSPSPVVAEFKPPAPPPKPIRPKPKKPKKPPPAAAAPAAATDSAFPDPSAPPATR